MPWTRRLFFIALVLATALTGAVTAPVLSEPDPRGTTDPPATERLSGPNRFATAAAVSAAGFPTASTVYVAPGGQFPQALAGGPRAARDDAPLLLVEADRLPTETAAELDRLGPDEIVLLGNTDDVAEEIATALGAYGTVRRIAGDDPVETVAEIARDGWPAGADGVLIATSAAFPDALNGGVAGALGDMPVLLVDPDGVPAATAEALDALAPDAIALLGGTAAISDDVALALGELSDGVIRRLWGRTRLETAIDISHDVHHDGMGVDDVYLATAGNFPDAMTAAPTIAAGGGALLLTNTDCVPGDVRDEIARLAPERLVVLGGTAVVSEAAAALTLCEVAPPAPEFSVVEEEPAGELSPVGDSGPRSIAKMTSDGDNETLFVEDELILVTDDPDVLGQALADTGGEVIRTIPGFSTMPTTHVIKVPQAASFAQSSGGQLRGYVTDLNWDATGAHVLSSNAALGTLGMAAELSVQGYAMGLNMVAESHGLIERDVEETTAVADNNPFEWPQFREVGAPGIGTAEAWRILQVAGREDATVTIGVIDGGFAMTNGDYPPGVTGNTGNANPMNCGTPGSCPWHGTNVSVAAAGEMDNGFGSVGAAGPVGRVRQYTQAGSVDAMIANIQQAVADGVDIINMSFGGSVDAVGTLFVDEGEDATEAAWAAGVMVFASAGNDGKDVDLEDCFLGCWEEEWVWPCENDGVVCVGGLRDASRSRAGGSNFGREWCGNPFCDVDFFAPYTVFVGEDPNNPGDRLRSVNGTSYSSPYAAGVAALVMAAQPSFGPQQVLLTLAATAQTSNDSTVGRILNAKQAVLAATGNLPPLAEITEPQDNDQFFYNGLGNPIPEAVIAVADGTPDDVEWEMTRVGTNTTTSVNPTLPLQFPAPDFYILRLEVTHNGETTTDQVTVAAINDPPGATITSPANDGDEVTQGIQVTISGTAQDANEQLGLDCNDFRWTLDGQPFATGCNPTVAFNDTGQHTLVLTVTDEQGASGSATRIVNVVAPPSQGPPIVSITQPSEGQFLGGSDTHQLAASASDPDGDPMTYEWTVTYGSGAGTTKSIGTTLNMPWRPDDDVPFNCGGQSATLRLTATAQDGSTSDEVEVYIGQPPC